MDGDDTFEEFERVAMTGAAALSRAAEVLIRNAQGSKVRAAAETARATEDLQRRAEAQAQAAERYYARTVEPGWVRNADADEVALAWKGAHQWAQIDADRFAGYADALNDQVRTECGFNPRDVTPGSGRNSGGGDLDALTRGCREQIDARREQDGGNTPLPGVGAGGVDAGRTPAGAELDYDSAERRAATSAELIAAGVSEPARTAKMTADHLNGTDPQVGAIASTPRRGRATVGPEQTRKREHGRGR